MHKRTQEEDTQYVHNSTVQYIAIIGSFSNYLFILLHPQNYIMALTRRFILTNASCANDTDTALKAQ